MTKSNRSGRGETLHALILSEGYCCLHGYLNLCEIRGETRKGMANNFKRGRGLIDKHFIALKNGTLPCQKREDCLLPTIEIFRKEKSP